ncbi:Enamidase [Symmachiella macrocystis]|uniref:Enamidase n=2 Tax=Symmachiella macrocystis TaxID=2527985 RepID=A0A5C6BM86_9PLAN|nr:Enamidase [Symmachiella macrocystis]
MRLALFVAVCLVHSTVTAAEPPPLVLRDAAVFDTAIGTMLPERTVVVEDGLITAIGTREEPATIPDGATVVEAGGKYVIPGLIDAHVHLVHLADRTHVTGDEFLPLFLAAGVTSVRSAGDAIVAEVGIARYAALHPEFCPQVFLASPLIDGARPVHRDIGYSLTDPALVPAFVDEMSQWNVVTLKIYVGTPRAIGQKVIEEGHRRGMIVTGHLGRYTAQESAADGIDCLEHIWSVFNYSISPAAAKVANPRANLDLQNPQCQALIAQLAKQKVAVDPTLVVFRNMIYLNDLEEVHQHADLKHVPKRMLRYWEKYRASSNLAPETRPLRLREIEKYQELTGLLHQAGVTILVGTDTPEPFVPPGFSLHQELEMLVASGLSPAAALSSATLNNARIVQQSDMLGSIEVGKQADLVVLSADPLQDIRNTRKIVLVVHGGQVCDPAKLLERVSDE